MNDILQGLIDAVAAACGGLVSVLPMSPFKSLSSLTIDNELLSFIAWLIPFPEIITALELWGTAVGLWYVYSIIMRWIKMIE